MSQISDILQLYGNLQEKKTKYEIFSLFGMLQTDMYYRICNYELFIRFIFLKVYTRKINEKLIRKSDKIK